MTHEAECEYCEVERIVIGTSFVGCYCEACHSLNIEHSKDAIRQIREAKRAREAERQAREAQS